MQNINKKLHVAIIMDGNGRWAKNHSLPRVEGHKKGAEITKKIIEACPKLNIQYLTLYAFSSENWRRSSEEVENIMSLLRYYLNSKITDLTKNNIKIKVIGNLTLLPKDIIENIRLIEEASKNNNELYLNIAISYGGRDEIINATKIITQKCIEQKIAVENINEELFADHMLTTPSPEPDLLIRTSGEQRLSNFLLWQSAYTELFFPKILWPEFTVDHLKDLIKEYYTRDRRYGLTEL